MTETVDKNEGRTLPGCCNPKDCGAVEQLAGKDYTPLVGRTGVGLAGDDFRRHQNGAVGNVGTRRRMTLPMRGCFRGCILLSSYKQ
jgi:hypothetical protein